MHESMKPLKTILEFNNHLFNLGAINLTDELANKIIKEGTNSALWLIGHIIEGRYSFNFMLGSEEKSPWGEMFNKSVSDLEADKIPTIAELKAAWEAQNKKTFELLEKIADEQLKADSEWKFPTSDRSVLAGLSFLTLHESYHAGQLSSHRKMLDLPSTYEMALEHNI